MGREEKHLTPPTEKAKELFHTAMGSYQELVGELGIVQMCYLGKKPGLKTGYIWEVLIEDFTPEQMRQDPRFAKLDKGAEAAIAGSKNYMPIRVAIVMLSHAAILKEKYEQDGFILEVQPVQNTQSVSTTNPETTAFDGKTGLDFLIGGLEPADVKLQEAHEAATRAIKDFRGGSTETEEIFGLDRFTRMGDKKAGEMLKDITLARNSVIKGGYARGLELLAEPIRVLQDIVENVFDLESTHNITELDVRGAIESGALSVPEFKNSKLVKNPR